MGLKYLYIFYSQFRRRYSMLYVCTFIYLIFWINLLNLFIENLMASTVTDSFHLFLIEYRVIVFRFSFFFFFFLYLYLFQFVFIIVQVFEWQWTRQWRQKSAFSKIIHKAYNSLHSSSHPVWSVYERKNKEIRLFIYQFYLCTLHIAHRTPYTAFSYMYIRFTWL